MFYWRRQKSILLFFSLHRYLDEPKPTGRDLENREIVNAEQSLFIQEVLLATLTDSQLTLGGGTASVDELPSADNSSSPQLSSVDTMADAASQSADADRSPESAVSSVGVTGRVRNGPVIAQASPDPDERR